jgi:RND family efflux transporter MFP subunit
MNAQSHMQHVNVRSVAWWLIGVIVVIGVITGIAIISRAHKPAAPVARSETAALSVSIVHPKPMLWPRVITASGNLAPWQEAVISAQLPGAPIAEVLVDVGDTVQKGQLLARFDETAVNATLDQYGAQVSEAEAHLIEARSSAERAERLRRTQNLSDQDLITAQTAAAAAEARLKAAKAHLESEQLMLGHTRVVAPDAGVISSRSATLGKVAAMGTELFRLVRQNRLEWRAELTAPQIVLVKPGTHARVRLPDGHTVSGTVRQLAPILADTTRTGIAYVDLDDPTGAARAGMYAAGDISLGEQSGLAVPASALVTRDGRNFVFVVAGDKHVVLTTVTTGQRYGDDVEIAAGLTPTMPVVEAGGAFLSDGDRVRVVASGASS